jgi:hypothetical protein
MKTRCKFQAVARKEQGNQWRLEILDNNHNYDAVAALSALPQYRIAAMTLEEKAKVKQMRSENHSASSILISLRNTNLDSMLVAQDIYNLLASLRVEEPARKTPIEWLLEVRSCSKA